MAFFAIGDFLGVATKAKVSSVFVSLLLFLIFFMADWIPDDVINQAGLTQIGKWAVGFVVFGMGTTINMRELMAEWRTVATACLSMAVIWIGMIVLVPLIGYNETIVAIPIINGGIVATQIMTSAAMENGLEMAAALGTILYAVQKFFGTPFASYFGLREAREVLAVYRQTGVNPNKAQPKAGEEPKLAFFDKHKKYYGQFVCLGITAFFSWVAWCIGQFTGLSYTIWCLILGAIMATTGLVPKNILAQAKSGGIFNVAVFASIIPSLAKIELGELDQTVYDAIDEVRGRAGMPGVSADRKGNIDKMRQLVRRERKVELALEGLLFVDVRRWGICDLLNQYPSYGQPLASVRYEGMAGCIPNFKASERNDLNDIAVYTGYADKLRVRDRNRYWDDKFTWWPIPRTETDRDPNLTNPGY